MRRNAACLILGVLIVLGGCKSTPPPSLRPTIPPDEATFLPDPTQSFTGPIDPALRATIKGAYGGFVQGQSPGAVGNTASSLLAQHPKQPPLLVLAGQASYLEGRAQEALENAEQALDLDPAYPAALLLAARASEALRQGPAAFQFYSRLGSVVPIAAQKADLYRSEAISHAQELFRVASAEKRWDDAASIAEQLEEWDPSSLVALEARLHLASMNGDEHQELELLRGAAHRLADRGYQERLATLEVKLGDVLAGLTLWEILADQFPEDQDLKRQVDRAKFRWQVERLPSHVQKIGHKSALSRGDVASLLFWLVPQIRHTPAVNPPIASDILDHPDRQAILRVTGLGILSVDETLHKFAPNQPILRRSALQAVLELLIREKVSCAGPKVAGRDQRPSVCRRAASCGLIETEERCLANEGISGSELIDILKQGLDLIEERE